MTYRFQASRALATSLRIHDPKEQRATPGRQRIAVPPKVSLVVPEPDEPADLYFRKQSRGLDYRHFDSADAAMRFIRDTLSSKQQGDCVLQVGERRFEGREVVSMLKRQQATG